MTFYPKGANVLLRLFAWAALLALVTACAPAVSREPGPPATAEAPAARTPPTTDSTRPARRAITLAFVGDILLDSSVGDQIARHGPFYPWQEAAPFLQAADIAAGNLETAVATVGEPADKQYVFRSRPATLDGVSKSGLDVLSLANNHTLDFGPEALLQTVRELRSRGLTPVGAGANEAEAYTPAIIESHGLKIGFLAFSRVIPELEWAAAPGRPGMAVGYDPNVVLKAVRRVAPEVDALVVLLHWGIEVQETPRPSDVDLTRRMFEHGATLVIGAHPHVLQGIEWRDGKLAAYSLGNFVFTSVARQLNQETGVLTVVLEPGAPGSGARARVAAATFRPMYLEAGRPRLLHGKDAGAILHRLDRLSAPMGTLVLPDGRLQPAKEAAP